MIEKRREPAIIRKLSSFLERKEAKELYVAPPDSMSDLANLVKSRDFNLRESSIETA